MRWGEVINPSDKTMICIDDPAAAAVATLIVGNGRYAVEGPGGEKILPLFLFGGEADVEKFFREKYGCGWKDVPLDRVEAAAQTAQYGTPAEIESMTEALADLPEEARVKAWAKYTDKKRSSMSRIVDAFHALKFKKKDAATA